MKKKVAQGQKQGKDNKQTKVKKKARQKRQGKYKKDITRQGNRDKGNSIIHAERGNRDLQLV